MHPVIFYTPFISTQSKMFLLLTNSEESPLSPEERPVLSNGRQISRCATRLAWSAGGGPGCCSFAQRGPVWTCVTTPAGRPDSAGSGSTCTQRTRSRSGAEEDCTRPRQDKDSRAVSLGRCHNVDRFYIVLHQS